MEKLIKTGVLAIGLLLTGYSFSVFAQTPSAARTAKDVSPSPVIVSQNVGSWTVRCAYGAANDTQKTDKSVQACVGEQFLNVKDKNGQVIQIATLLLDKSKSDAEKLLTASQPFKLTLVTPPGFSLEKPITLAVDNTTPMSLPWITCAPQGCISSMTMPPSLKRELGNGKTGHLLIHKVNGTTLTVNFDLKDTEPVMTKIDTLINKKTP